MSGSSALSTLRNFFSRLPLKAPWKVSLAGLIDQFSHFCSRACNENRHPPLTALQQKLDVS